MTDCPHRTAMVSAAGCRLLPPNLAVTPAFCRRCQEQWPDSAPPTPDRLPPLLAAAIAREPEPEAPRGRCDHLGQVVRRQRCNCWQQNSYQCDQLLEVVTPATQCQQCEHWVSGD